MYAEQKELGCCSSIMRGFILLINGLLSLAGLGIIGIGMWMYKWDTIALAGEELALIVMAFGGIVFIIGMCGFLSACKQWVCGLWIFSILLFLIICCEVAVIIYVFTNENASESFIRARWEDLNEESREGFQEQFGCCGWDASIPGENCPEDVASDEYCWQFIKNTIEAEKQVVLYVGIGIVLLETIMLVFTICLRYEVKEVKEAIANAQMTLVYG